MKTLKQQHITQVAKTGNAMIIAPEFTKGNGIAIGIELVKDKNFNGEGRWKYAHVSTNIETGEKAYGQRFSNFEDARVSHEINMQRA